MTDTRYNGWTNRQTWNVALWIGNDEGLYHLAREHRDRWLTEHDDSIDGCYDAFASMLRDDFGNTETPDHVAWNDSGLDTDELDAMLKEL